MKALMEEECKQTTLQRARQLTEVNSFTYYDEVNVYNIRVTERESSDLANKVLGCFSLGCGLSLPDGRFKSNSHSKEEVEKDQQAFRERFYKQIKQLIKRDPRLTKDENGNWAIFYS